MAISRTPRVVSLIHWCQHDQKEENKLREKNDNDISTLSLIDSDWCLMLIDADAVTPSSNIRSYTRRSIPSSLWWSFLTHSCFKMQCIAIAISIAMASLELIPGLVGNTEWYFSLSQPSQSHGQSLERCCKKAAFNSTEQRPFRSIAFSKSLWLQLRLYPCSNKTREVLGNPSPTPKRFPEGKASAISRAEYILSY